MCILLLASTVQRHSAPAAQGTSRSRRRRVGAAVVEFALVIPLFLLFLVGIIEFGRLMMVEQILTNAAREGGRRAVVASTTTADVQAVVNNYLANSGISGATVTVSADPSTAIAGDAITVTVSVDFDNVSWINLSTALAGKKLSASVVMRKETNNT